MIIMQYGSGTNQKGEGGGVVLESLWTNSSPSSSFSGQTVTLSKAVSEYTLLLFVYIFSTGKQDYNTRTYPVATLEEGVDCTLQINAGSSNRTGARNFSLASETTVTFGGASYNGASNNGYVIPTQIFGIR